jgi:hypothetical protein
VDLKKQEGTTDNKFILFFDNYVSKENQINYYSREQKVKDLIKTLNKEKEIIDANLNQFCENVKRKFEKYELRKFEEK